MRAYKKRSAERNVKRLATLIQNQAALDKILDDVNPQTARKAVFEKIRPHLPFTPDCPDCGLRRGCGVDRECK